MSSCRAVFDFSASRIRFSTLPMVVCPATAVTVISTWPVMFAVPA